MRSFRRLHYPDRCSTIQALRVKITFTKSRDACKAIDQFVRDPEAPSIDGALPVAGLAGQGSSAGRVNKY